jgi:signal recognition particle subunit SRP68
LNSYPSDGHVDLANLVTYPPKLEPIPVKPLFFDVAYNYIQYPGKNQGGETPQATAPREENGKEQQPAKKGWFGFGRS